MRPSAVSMLFPKLFPAVVGQKTGKGPPAQQSRPAISGMTHEQIDRQYEGPGRTFRGRTPDYSGVPRTLSEMIGSPVSRHSEMILTREKVPTSSRLPVNTQPELRGLSPEALEAWNNRQPKIDDPIGRPPGSQPQGAHTFKLGESVRLSESPVGDVVRESVLLAMATGDTLRSIRLGVQPEAFLNKLWTEYFTRAGSTEPAARAAEFLEASDTITRGDDVFSVHPELDNLITDFQKARDNSNSRSFDLADTTNKLMSGYGAFPEKIVVTTQWQDAQVTKILGLLDIATVIDFDPYLWKSQGTAELEAPYTPHEAKAILRSWKGFGPPKLRAKLQAVADGTLVYTPAEMDAVLAPMQNSVEARKVREMAMSGEEVWTNMLGHFRQREFGPSAWLSEEIGPDGPRDLAIAVRQKYQPNPDLPNFQADKNNIEFYQITRGYEGKDAPDIPKVSRIEYVQREPDFVEIPTDDKGNTRFEQPANEPTERRVREGPTGESWDTLFARLSSDESKEIAVLQNAHSVIWGGTEAVPNILANQVTPEGYQVAPSGIVRQQSNIVSKEVQFPSRPQNVPIPTTRGQYVSGSGPMDALLNPFRPRQQQTAHQNMAQPGRLREIIESLNDQDMRNVFSPGKTNDEIEQYLIGKMPEQEADAIAAARLITATRGVNRRAWNLMELRNMRAARGDILQRTGVDIGDTDNLTQLQLDNKRRNEILKHADSFVEGGGSFEGELIRRSVGGF